MVKEHQLFACSKSPSRRRLNVSFRKFQSSALHPQRLHSVDLSDDRLDEKAVNSVVSNLFLNVLYFYLTSLK
jgi:hypothetical protein